MVDLDRRACFRGVADLVEDSLYDWHTAGSEFPRLEGKYSKSEQKCRENLLDSHLEAIDAELLQASRTRTAPEATLARLASEFVQISSYALELEDPAIKLLLRDGFSQIALDLARWARRFDPAVSMADILQAARNAWTACGLQFLLGKTVRLTPAIFAYSMLYPYSDNYLDEKTITGDAKLQFSERFRRRLDGERPAARNEREEMISRLVGLIESEYPRREFPHVYGSLLAIHAAQQDSIRQMQKDRGGHPIEVARLTVTKGGTSVLADAYLAAGDLSQDEAEFAFNWGVVLQLGDDLQDFRCDSERGSLTLFTQAAHRETLDRITNKTLHFSQAAMLRMARLSNGTDVLRDLLTRSSRMLLIRSAANLPELYSEAYLAELENFSPFGFEFLRTRERRFARRRKSYSRLFEQVVRVPGESKADRSIKWPLCGDPSLSSS
ncbi:MAG: hypothetical protein JO138_26580 [Acidobacteriaceae bacterium]|nr:hypothetical protein [Acidobacteriaceae bacterium]